MKVEAIRLTEESDQSVAQVTRKLGLQVSQIYEWRKQLEDKPGDAFLGKQTATDKDTKILTTYRVFRRRYRAGPSHLPVEYLFVSLTRAKPNLPMKGISQINNYHPLQP